MRRLIHRISTTSILGASLLSTSCSLQNPAQTPLHIEIPRSTELNKSALHSRVQSTAGNYTTAPASLSDFDCFAVNVTAPEIAPQAPQPCTLPSDMIGVAGGWVSANAANVSIDLMVPSGSDRLIQIYGVRTPDQCPLLGDFKSARLGDVYLIGSMTQDIFDDTDVSIKAHLETSKKALTSCQTAPAISLGTTTYYVLGPTGTSVTLPLPNSGQYTLTSVSATTNGYTSVTDAGDHIHFSYNPNSIRGIDQFTYTAIDSSGKTGTGNIVIKNVTPTTWTGEYGDHDWSSAGNWCGSVNGAHTACNNTGPVPTSASTAYFDGTCSPANCSANIETTTAISSLYLDPDYLGTITESASAALNISHMLQIQGGTLILPYAATSLNTAQLVIDGGSLISSASSMSLGGSYGVAINNGLLDLSSAASVSLGDLNISGGTLHAPENGMITYNGAITFAGGTINPGATLGAYATLNNSIGATISLHLNSPMNFQNLQIQSANSTGNYQLNNSLNVQGKLTLNGKYGGTAPSLTGGSITIQGDLTVDTNDSGYYGDTSIILNGSGNQTMTLASGAYIPNLNVNKTGTLTINNSSPINTFQSLVATQVIHNGTGLLTLPSGVLNVGTIAQNGSGTVFFANSTLNGDLIIQSGQCTLTAPLVINGNLNIGLTGILDASHNSLSYLSISNLGSLINP